MSLRLKAFLYLTSKVGCQSLSQTHPSESEIHPTFCPTSAWLKGHVVRCHRPVPQLRECRHKTCGTVEGASQRMNTVKNLSESWGRAGIPRLCD